MVLWNIGYKSWSEFSNTEQNHIQCESIGKFVCGKDDQVITFSVTPLCNNQNLAYEFR